VTWGSLPAGAVESSASREPPVDAGGESPIPFASRSTVLGDLSYRFGVRGDSETSLEVRGEAMGARGSLVVLGGWAEAFADGTRQRLLAAGQFSSPEAVAVATRTEELLSLGEPEVFQRARRRAVGVAMAPSVFSRCSLA
jgi:hypothetical protein